MLTVNQQCSIVKQNNTNIQKMVSITVFSMMLVVLCIGTAVGAPTKRQSSDVDLLNLNRAVLTLKYFAANLRKSLVSTQFKMTYSWLLYIDVLLLQFSPNITNDVRFAVCILRDFDWSGGDVDQSNFSALVSIKEAVINNSCSWVRLILHVSCHCIDDAFIEHCSYHRHPISLIRVTRCAVQQT